MIDYGALLFDPVYAELGVAATMNGVEITVIDDTRSKPLPSQAGSITAEVRSTGPGAFARVYELTGKGIERGSYRGATLSFNDKTWVVYSYDFRGSPNGVGAGEVLLLLKETAAL